ncbi:hypothetical protein L6R53_22080 [Myxococcota bacterium]|nr:hypothetical protein [Myxococcota bacterium]
MSLPAALLLLPLACGDKDDGDDSGGGASTGDGGTGSHTAELAPLSSGECPDMTASGTSTFLSSDEERTVTVLLPEDASGPMPVVFFFHGLMDPASTPQPGEYMATALGLQDLADEHGAVVILPESGVVEMLGLSFFLWDMLGDGAKDLALFDDLRTCAAQELEVDLDRVVAMGFSGGALWTTEVLSQRGDTLAAAVEMSGGADVEIPLAEDPIAEYDTPAWALPVLLQSGGESDVWPNASFAVVDFSAATDTLQDELVEDGSLVVRCEHSRGHTVTNDGYELAVAWAVEHAFQQPSPWLDGDLGDDADWCEAFLPTAR